MRHQSLIFFGFNMKDHRGWQKSMAGFTLIELMVVVTITLLMVGGGLAAFVNFNERQTILGGAKELQSILRAAQQKAQISDKPETGCDRLSSYVVRANQTAPVTVTVYAKCQSGEVLRSTKTLNSSLSLSGPLQVTFRSLQGGVEVPATITVTSTLTNQSYEFEVTSGGEITEGALDDQ
jgi:prepilin-type N-terminal cleavage/methylation domain-containing protein